MAMIITICYGFYLFRNRTKYGNQYKLKYILSDHSLFTAVYLKRWKVSCGYL